MVTRKSVRETKHKNKKICKVLRISEAGNNTCNTVKERERENDISYKRHIIKYSPFKDKLSLDSGRLLPPFLPPERVSTFYCHVNVALKFAVTDTDKFSPSVQRVINSLLQFTQSFSACRSASVYHSNTVISYLLPFIFQFPVH